MTARGCAWGTLLSGLLWVGALATLAWIAARCLP